MQPQCAWQRNLTAIGVYCEHTGEADGPKYADDIWRSPHPVPAVWVCDEKLVRGVIAGPFSSDPGHWTTVGLDITSLLQSGDPITQYIGDAVFADGTSVPYPPLHMHHIHVARQRWRRDGKRAGGSQDQTLLYQPHWFETHGDYLQSAGVGYATNLPPGWCDVFEPGWQVLVEAQINDVRFQVDAAMSRDTRSDGSNSSNAPLHGKAASAEVAALRHGHGASPLQWYLRIAFRLSPTPSCAAAHKLLIMHPQEWAIFPFERQRRVRDICLHAWPPSEMCCVFH